MAINVFLGLGSNLGDRKKNILDAYEKISNDDNSKLICASSFYETSPYGIVEQDKFLNTVIKIETDYSIETLFTFVKKVEIELGRTNKGIKWGPREIDIDILFYNDLIYKSDNLIIPHTGILKRDFVIVPMIEIAPDFVYPGLNKRLGEIDISQIEKHIISKL